VENSELIIQNEKAFKIAKSNDDAKEKITISQYGFI
jgi:hypothetical protein